MATETRETVYNIKLNATEAIATAAELHQKIEGVKEAMKQEAAQNGKGTIAYQQKAAQLKVLTAQYNSYSKFAVNSMKLEGQQADALKAMRLQVSLLTQEYDGLGKAEREAAQGTELRDRIAGLTAELSKQEQALGNFRRNVGNYGSAYNGLNIQAQQLVRELPSLTVSANQFFLAISNNLPMFFDEIQKVRMEAAALRKEGKAAPSVIKTVLSSFLSMQTLLAVGVTLLAQYGGELVKWIGELLEGKHAADSTAASMKALNEAMDFSGLGKQIANINLLADAWARLGDDAEAKAGFIQKYKDEIADTGLAINDVNDAETVFGSPASTQKVIDAMVARAQAAASLKLYEEQITEAIEYQARARQLAQENSEREEKRIQNWANANTLLGQSFVFLGNNIGRNFDLTADRAERLNYKADKAFSRAENYLTFINELTATAAEKSSELAVGFAEDAEDAGKTVDQLASKFAGNIVKIQQEMVKTLNEGSRQGEIRQLMHEYAETLKTLEDTVAEYEKIDFGNLSQEEAAAAKTAYEEVLANLLVYRDKLAENLAKDISEVNKKYDRQEFEALSILYRRRILEAGNNAAERLKIELEAFEAEKEMLEKNGEETIEVDEKIAKKQNEILKERLKTLQAIVSQEAEEMKEGSIERLQLELQGMQEELRLRQQLGEDTVSLQREIANQVLAIERAAWLEGYEIDNSNYVTRYRTTKERLLQELELYKNNAEKMEEIRAAMAQNEEEFQTKLRDDIFSIADQINEVFNGITDLISSQVEQQVASINDTYDKAEQNLADMYARGAYTEAEYNAESMRLQKEREDAIAEARIREAKAERAASVFSITVSTAQAIVQAWTQAQANPIVAGILTGLISAASALQMAAVLSAPLPTASRGRYIHGRTHAQGGEVIEAEAGEVIINRRSTARFLPLLSAINEAGGGIPFASAGYDGGYVMRHAGMDINPNIEQAIAKALNSVKIVATIQDIKRQEANYMKIQSNKLLL